MVSLALGYIGIYLCRKNLAVAVPLLGDAFHASRAELGRIASIGTAAYAVGKLTLSPIVDRVGGRVGFVTALFLVAGLGAATAAAPSYTALALLYGASRWAGAGGWPSMMKLVPTWFRAGHGTMVAGLSLSYVAGGIAATLLARAVVTHGGGWRAVFLLPSLALLAIALACASLVRTGPMAASDARERAASQASATAPATAAATPRWRALLSQPPFLVVCALSLSLTLMREAFNTWSVDFLASVQPPGARSLARAALQSTGFDVAGAASILAMGVAYDRTPVRARRFLLAGILTLLAALLALLPWAATRAPAAGAWLVGLAGLLVYGPYSLLAGVMAVECGGAAAAATAAGIIDAVGYVGAVLAGEGLGRVLDAGGYRLGFACLAAITAVSAIIALALRPPRSDPPEPSTRQKAGAVARAGLPD